MKKIRTLKAIYQDTEVKEGESGYLALGETFTSSLGVFTALRFLSLESKEHFIAIHLDIKNKVLCLDEVSVGSLNASIVHPREVYKSALLSSAASVLFVHNHPSGDTTPSREDIDLTKRLKNAGDLLGIRVLDHVIVGSEHYLSFADQGLI